MVVRQIVYLLMIFIMGIHSANAQIPVEKMITPGKLPILFVKDTNSNFITVSIGFKDAGRKADPKGLEGIGALSFRLIFADQEYGLSQPEVEISLKKLGVLGGFSSKVAADHVWISLTCPQKNLEKVLSILEQFFIHPDFRGIKTETGNAYKSLLAEQDLLKKVFLDHPYGQPSSGTSDSSINASLKDVNETFNARFARDNIVICVVGNIEQQRLKDALDKVFLQLPEKNQLSDPKPPKMQFKGGLSVIAKKTEQSAIGFVHPALLFQHPDYYKLRIINDIIGGKPFTSRLWKEIREKRGLTYGITTELETWSQAAIIIGSLETDNEKVNEAIDIIQAVWRDVAMQGVTEAEFQRAKKGIIGEFALNFTTPQGIANTVLSLYLEGLGEGYVNQRNRLIEPITYADIQAAIKKYIDPKKLTFVVVGNKPEPISQLS